MNIWKMTYRVDESKNETANGYLYVTLVNTSLNPPLRKAGVSGIKKSEDVATKLTRYSTCVPQNWKLAFQVAITNNGDLKQLEDEFFDIIEDYGGKRYHEKELFAIKDNDKLFDAIVDFIDEYDGILVACPKEFKIDTNKLDIDKIEKNLINKIKENKMEKKYTKKQITEAIAYWENRLKQMNESEDVHDKDVHDETELILDIPNMPPVDVEFEGEWHGVRFAIDLFTDAIAHMKSVDPAKYGDVKFHVKH